MDSPGPGERVADAVNQLAIEHPLPDAFWQAAATAMPDAPVRRLNRAWFGAAGALAVVLVGAFLVASRPASLAGQLVPAPSASAVASATPTIHYIDGQLSFDYPADWDVLGKAVDEHYIQLGPAFGIGSWHVPCSITPTSEVCAPPVSTVPPGGVVVELRTFSPPVAVPPTAPPGGALRPDGFITVESETPNSSTWDLYPPSVSPSSNQPVYVPMITISATYRAPDAELHRAEVRALVASFQWRISP